jgi:hypothetical protein
MGRPKKNRRKAPEEKMKKGVKVFTKAGVTIHCSVCGKADHNKRGHLKFVQDQVQQQQDGIIQEDEDYDIPEIIQVRNNNTLYCITQLQNTLYYTCLYKLQSTSSLPS